MKRTLIVLSVNILSLFLAGCMLYAQQAKEIVLKDIKPTLSGYTNNAFVSTEKVGPDKKEMTTFRRNANSAAPLVTAGGGRTWGTGVSLRIGHSIKTPSGDAWTGSERQLSGDAHVGIEGDNEFIGNLDYDGSTYTFVGTVHLAKHVFVSDEKDHLVFKLVMNKGFVYQKGKGKVTLPDGKSITIP